MSLLGKHVNFKFLLKPKLRVKFRQTQKVKFNRFNKFKASRRDLLKFTQAHTVHVFLNFAHHIVDNRLRAVSIRKLKQSFARSCHVEALNQAQYPLAACVLLT